MNTYRSIFISDTHLGTRFTHSEKLKTFLLENESNNLFLVGDIFDIWMHKRWFWNKNQNDILDIILEKSIKTKIIYIPGNHDRFIRILKSYLKKIRIGNIKIVEEYIYYTIDKKRILVTHGDKYDPNEKLYSFVYAGNLVFDAVMLLVFLYSGLKKIIPLPDTLLLQKIRNKFKKIDEYISMYEKALINRVKEIDFDGVICGHIHVPEHKMIEDKLYCNCGDWIESCSAIVEHNNGKIELIKLA